MPRRILTELLRQIEHDITTVFHTGDRYRSVREIASLFGVSQQTAQRAVNDLVGRGELEARQRSGLFVPKERWKNLLFGKALLVVSANPDPRFNGAFIDGITSVAAGHGLTVERLSIEGIDISSLAFGEFLDDHYQSRAAIGIIALAFRRSDLAFYHLLSRGVTILSDVDSHGIPMLPSLQSDNRYHASEAARKLAGLSKRHVLVAGYWPPENTRHQAFRETFARLVPNGQCTYVHLADDMSVTALYKHFTHFSKSDAVFAVDYAANHTVAPYFLTHKVPTDGNLIVYDSEYDNFAFSGLPPIHAAAPSLYELGTKLAEKIIARLRDGVWAEPLRERI